MAAETLVETLTSLPDLAMRLGTALVCGAVLGLDREARHKAAGLRTLSLVSLGAAATTLVALGLTAQSGGDASRVIQGLAQAIGFISAGVIIRGQADVHGVTTAAVIWIAGALGIACAAGYYVVAGMTLVLTLASVYGFSWLERFWFKRETKLPPE